VLPVIDSLALGGRECPAVGRRFMLAGVSAENPRRPVSPRQGRKKVPRVVREREMLEVAGRVFAQRGFHAASMEEIAGGAGVSKPMIYNYFGSKEGLYFAYIELAGQRMLARMRDAVQAVGERPEERLWASALAFFGHVDDNRDEWSVLFGELAARGAPFSREVSAIRSRVSDGTAALFDEVLESSRVSPSRIGGTEPLAHAFVGAGESLANWWLDHPEESQAAMAARLMNVAWIGLSELLQSRADPWPLDHEPGSATRASSSPRARRRTRKRA
jgi:AcrR family transcriptional regulator